MAGRGRGSGQEAVSGTELSDPVTPKASLLKVWEAPFLTNTKQILYCYEQLLMAT